MPKKNAKGKRRQRSTARSARRAGRSSRARYRGRPSPARTPSRTRRCRRNRRRRKSGQTAVRRGASASDRPGRTRGCCDRLRRIDSRSARSPVPAGVPSRERIPERARLPVNGEGLALVQRKQQICEKPDDRRHEAGTPARRGQCGSPGAGQKTSRTGRRILSTRAEIRRSRRAACRRSCRAA